MQILFATLMLMEMKSKIFRVFMKTVKTAKHELKGREKKSFCNKFRETLKIGGGVVNSRELK